jgi:polygalacturonase
MTSRKQSRREFVRTTASVAGAVLVAPSLACHGATPSAAPKVAAGTAGWGMVPGILARIVPPTFPDRDFDVTRYGAVGDGTTDCTRAFRDAIAACNAAGGGRVLVSAGRFLTGAIHLKSRVNLHVAKGATIAFSREPAAYLPPVFTRWEGTELMSYSPFIYAFEQTDVAITGEGTLDGQADAQHWWNWRRDGATNRQVPARNRLMAMAAEGVPVAQRVFAEGSYLRPQFIQPYRCRNVLIEGVTIINSPMWEIHPCLCTNVTVRGVNIASHGPNNDGCDPESCTDVLIDRCTFDTGDDCIAIKSGRNAEGRRVPVPTENVIVRNCRMKDGHGGVTLGSEITAGVRNVFIERCTMDSPNLERALRLKNNAARGGVLEHVYMRDVTVGVVTDSVLSVDLYYEEGPKGAYTPVIRDVEMRNVRSGKSRYALFMRAYPRSEIDGVRVIDCVFDGVERGNVTQGVRRLTLTNVRINGRPATPTSHEVAPPSDKDLLPSDMRAPSGR